MNIEPSKLKKRFEDFKIFSISKRPISNSKLTIYQQSTKIFGTGSEKNLARPEENQIKKQKLKHDRSLKCIEVKVLNELNFRKLGPGKYIKNGSNLIESHSFSSLPRFFTNHQEKFLIRKEKSPICSPLSINNRIRINKDLSSQSPEAKKNNLEQTKKSKNFAILRAQKNKKKIYQSLILERQKSLEIKKERREKIGKNVNSLYYQKSWAYVLCLFGSFCILSKNYSLRLAIRSTTKKLTSLLYFVSKVIGKLKIICRLFRKNRAIRFFGLYLTPFAVKIIMNTRANSFRLILQNIERYLSRFLFRSLMHA